MSSNLGELQHRNDKNNFENKTEQDQQEWFTESATLNSDDLLISTRINKVIHRHRSAYQNIFIFHNKIFGRCLVLDDAMQCTELDESAYQEMIAFLPLNLHHHPKRILIVGGGDGGVARECSKHPQVEQIVQCEIDRQVVEASRQYLPWMGQGFDSKKLVLQFEDGYRYVREHPDEFDVIITDSCDPKGPAESLFKSGYFQSLFHSLQSGGLICSQAESYWFELQFIKDLLKKVKKIFPSVAYASASVPSYPSGQIGFLIASKEPNLDFRTPKHRFNEQDCDRMKLKYSEDMHRASFVLPRFVQKALLDL